MVDVNEFVASIRSDCEATLAVSDEARLSALDAIVTKCEHALRQAVARFEEQRTYTCAVLQEVERERTSTQASYVALLEECDVA